MNTVSTQSKAIITVAMLVVAITGIYFYSSTTRTSVPIAESSGDTLPVIVSSKPLEKGKAILHVTSEPSGAQIYLDKRLLGKTPFQSEVLPAGIHEIILTHANTYNYKEEISLKDSVQVIKKFTLKYAFGSVGILSEPEGANVIVDGVDTRLVTPTVIKELVGDHHIKLRKDGYYPKEATITILNGVVDVEEFTLEGGHLQKHKGEWLEPERKAKYVATEKRSILNERAKLRSKKSMTSNANGYRKKAKEKAEIGDVDATKRFLVQAQWYVPDPKLDKKILARAKQRFNSVKDLLGQMVNVPKGRFKMGSIGGDSDEKPIHDVWVNPFRMGQYEVTQDQWLNVMANNPSSFNGCDECPVENVSWGDIQKFLEKLNKKTGQKFRLPSEAEWEYACRSGGRDELYCGGNSVYASAWYGKNSGKQTHPVKQKKPNGLGLYDMSGNVWEWTDDCANLNYKDSPSNSYAWKKGDCNKRVLRGGSWLNADWNTRSTDRSWFANSHRSYNLGFRLAQDY